MINNQNLPKDEAVCLELQTLYESYGYKKFRMRRFEEYSFYLDYENFLTSKQVLTFSDPSGKLLALRPDVTLSIIKNTKADHDTTEKLYYKENVYRVDRDSKSFNEIGQIGIECIGDINVVETAEILTMAARSLEHIEKDYILSVSHMGFITGLLDYAKIESESDKKQIFDCIRSANTHDLENILIKHSVPSEFVNEFSKLFAISNNFYDMLAILRKIAVNDAMKNALSDVENVMDLLSKTEIIGKIRLDLTVLSDVGYYNGIIMQGYVRSCKRAVLSGGRYDKLLEKFGKSIGAMGFAVFLGDLVSCYPPNSRYDFDVLLKYDDTVEYSKVIERANILRNEGLRVMCSCHSEYSYSYERLEDMTKGGDINA